MSLVQFSLFTCLFLSLPVCEMKVTGIGLPRGSSRSEEVCALQWVCARGTTSSMGKCSLLGLAWQWGPDLSAAQEAEASLGSVDPISEGKKRGYRSVVERSPDMQKPYHSVPNTMWRNSGQSQSLADTGFYSRIAVLVVRFVQSVAVPGVVAHTFSHGTQSRKIPWSSRPARAIKTLFPKKHVIIIAFLFGLHCLLVRLHTCPWASSLTWFCSCCVV